MKFKKAIILILIMDVIFSLNTQCYAKYVFEDYKKAAEIVINN